MLWVYIFPQGLLLVLDCHDSLPYTIVVELIEVGLECQYEWEPLINRPNGMANPCSPVNGKPKNTFNIHIFNSPQTVRVNGKKRHFVERSGDVKVGVKFDRVYSAALGLVHGVSIVYSGGHIWSRCEGGIRHGTSPQYEYCYLDLVI